MDPGIDALSKVDDIRILRASDPPCLVVFLSMLIAKGAEDDIARDSAAW